MVPVNYLAVFASVILSVILGTVWYGPLFGKIWTKEMGWTKEQMKKGAADKSAMMRSYMVQAVGSFIMAFVLAHSLIFAGTYLNVSGVAAGLQVGFWNWIGFIAPVTVTSVLWEGKSWKLWFLTNGYYLVTLCVMGVLLALWT